MRVLTSLPFPHVAFKHWGPDDREGMAVIVKGTFGISTDGGLYPAPDQPPIAEADSFHADPATSSLRTEQDLAPDKPRTDVTFALTARAPRGDPLPDWPVSVEIENRVFYSFHVRGPSFWQKQRNGWVLTAPERVREVPIRYELAYGGQAQSRDAPEVFQFNPAGRGFVTEHLLANEALIPAPQIGDLAEFMTGNIRAPMTVHGLGPLAKTWLPRRTEAGTFDNTWATTRHPRMPRDYSIAFWNAAPAHLQISPYLRGGERILMRGFRHTPGPLVVTLPNVCLGLRPDASVGNKWMMNLTDVQINMESDVQQAPCVTLIWRRFLDQPEVTEALHIEASQPEDGN